MGKQSSTNGSTPSQNDIELAGRIRTIVLPMERQLRAALKDPTAKPLTPTFLSVISAIVRHGPIALGELASIERLSQPSISKIVRELEDEGLIYRIGDKNDRRVSRVAVTKAGQKWVEDGRNRRDAWLASRIVALTPAQRAALEKAVPVLAMMIEPGN